MLKHFAIACRELIRDYHVTSTHADKGFEFAMVKSFFAILFA